MGGVQVLEDDDNTSLKNVQFYSNKLSSRPRGDFIDNIHKDWFGNHELLEAHHGYVQWLFPLRESGMNFSAQPLSKHESGILRKSKEIQTRCIKSYSLMLDFYGLVLKDIETGEICRNPKTFKIRMTELNHSFHNFLRITRICKWLGVIGLEHYKFKFLNHMILEIFKEKTLPNAGDSCVRYWIPTLRKKKHLLLLDALVKKCGRNVRRGGRDGWGDENESWFTKYYKDEVNDSLHNDSFVVLEKVLVAEKDPFESVREKFPVKISNWVSRRRRRWDDSDSDNDDGNDSDDDDERRKKNDDNDVDMDENEKDKEKGRYVETQTQTDNNEDDKEEQDK